MIDLLAELLGLMDEPRHAERLMASLAARDVRPEHRALVEAAACGLESRDEPTENWTATVCRFDTPCGEPAAVFVHFEPITGAVTDRVDVAGQVHGVCPEMLTDGATRRVAARSLGEDVR